MSKNSVNPEERILPTAVGFQAITVTETKSWESNRSCMSWRMTAAPNDVSQIQTTKNMLPDMEITIGRQTNTNFQLIMYACMLISYLKLFSFSLHRCECENCVPMHTVHESRCCKQVNVVFNMMETFVSDIDCITQHLGFRWTDGFSIQHNTSADSNTGDMPKREQKISEFIGIPVNTESESKLKLTAILYFLFCAKEYKTMLHLFMAFNKENIIKHLHCLKLKTK